MHLLANLSVRLATADLGLFMLSGSPSFQPGTCPDLGLFWMFSQKRSRPPASQSDPTLTWSALDGLDALVCCWLDDWIRMMAAGEEGLWGGGDFLLPIKSEKNHFFYLFQSILILFTMANIYTVICIFYKRIMDYQLNLWAKYTLFIKKYCFWLFRKLFSSTGKCVGTYNCVHTNKIINLYAYYS